MGAPTRTVVDPTNGNDASPGANGYLTIDGVFNGASPITRDATNGDIIELHNDAAHTLSGAISLVSYGTPTDEAQLTFIGTDTSGNDHAPGTYTIIDLAGFQMINDAAIDFVSFAHIRFRATTSAAAAMTIDNSCSLIWCEYDSNSLSGNHIWWTSGSRGFMLGNVTKNDGSDSAGMDTNSSGNRFVGNFFRTGTTATTGNRAIYTGNDSIAYENIIVCKDIASGQHHVDFQSDDCIFMRNSLINTGTSPQSDGVHLGGAANADSNSAIANICTDFDGTGATAIDRNSTTNITPLMEIENAYFNNTNDENITVAQVEQRAAGEALGSSPWQGTGSADDPDDKIDYYTPNDVGNIRDGGSFIWARTPKGAVGVNR
jgi:hypothetical protein